MVGVYGFIFVSFIVTIIMLRLQRDSYHYYADIFYSHTEWLVSGVLGGRGEGIGVGAVRCSVWYCLVYGERRYLLYSHTEWQLVSAVPGERAVGRFRLSIVSFIAKTVPLLRQSISSIVTMNGW